MRISDGSSDVCSSDLAKRDRPVRHRVAGQDAALDWHDRAVGNDDLDHAAGLADRDRTLAGFTDGAGQRLPARDADRRHRYRHDVRRPADLRVPQNDVNAAITAVVTGRDTNAYDDIDRSLAYMQVALSSIESLDVGQSEIVNQDKIGRTAGRTGVGQAGE